ncbi:hypothetical protein SDRG_14388 [Saprolegnia diclina VS20]|uniref:Uncharacterized protein n=1 Tax=Saprolegnia diclina (strain VS20) TaxID=1156394 RepID=T0PQL6_SAPDV|nr:hypothetical protein SDRG_14388 [Saprolegnia diclina VS20]EQC27804.1 hypothetical protein SDRG_14388 [Saprolegnia diclina VS20]|eukprot:XP_008618734.1 hypothetical protein SDRG_14388 [Saprolegnia diclina VS20]
MPILLRRNAPRPSVEELVDPISTRDLLAPASKATAKPEMRRGSVPVLPSTGESYFRKGRGRNSEGNFLNNNVFLQPTTVSGPASAKDHEGLSSGSASPMDEDVPPPREEKPRVSTYSMIVNNPLMVNTLAHELSLLPKTYLRLALERVVSSASRSISSMRRRPKKSPETKPSATSPQVPPSSGATSPTESDRNSTQQLPID